MNDGWLKLYRKITEWEWYNHSQMVHLFLHLVIKASSTDKVWQGIKVCRGQAIVSRPKLCAETGISERSIRTCLQRLVSSGEIQIKTTSKYSIITICKYGDYQPIEQQGDQQGDQPNDQQSDLQNGHIYRSKEEKNIIPVSANADTGSTTRTRKGDDKKKGKSETPEQPHEPGANRKLKSGKDVSLATRAQEVFMAYYEKEYGEVYAWRAKDMTAIKDVLSKITYSRKHKNPPQPIDDDSVLSAFTFFIQQIQKSWIRDNFSITKINSQYNEIIAEIKNSRNGTGKQFNTQEQARADILANQRAAIIDDIAKADELYYKGK